MTGGKRLLVIAVWVETVHEKCPLQRYDRPLHCRQQQKREDQGERQPQHRMKPQRRVVSHLNQEHQADHDMSYDGNREIRGRVIGTMMMQGLPAMRAVIGDFEITPK